MTDESVRGFKREGYSTLVLTEGEQTAIYDFDGRIAVYKTGQDVRVVSDPTKFREEVGRLKEGSEQLYRIGIDRSPRSFRYENMNVTSGIDVQKLMWQVGGIL